MIYSDTINYEAYSITKFSIRQLVLQEKIFFLQNKPDFAKKYTVFCKFSDLQSKNNSHLIDRRWESIFLFLQSRTYK